MNIATKRIYDDATGDDGYRVLVDRLWPRGVSKDRAAINEWIKDLGPSTELRQWFGHDPARFDEFRDRYIDELEGARELWQPLLDKASSEPVTLVYSAKDQEHNQAVVLRDFLAGQ